MSEAVTPAPQEIDLEAEAREVARAAGPWVARWARLGLVAKGVVYVVTGLLSVRAAFVAGEAIGDREAALKAIMRQPFGRAMLATVSVGLVGYVLWRTIQALFNPEKESNGFKGYATRAARFGSGVVYGGLAFAAVRLLTGWPRVGAHREARDWTRMLMSRDLGPWLVGGLGLAVLGFGLYQLYKSWAADLDDKLDLGPWSPAVRRWLVRLGRLGIASRGVVFVVIGSFLLVSAAETNPDEARGLAGALASLDDYGPGLLASAAAGLIAYGLWQFMEAKYRRIQPLRPAVARLGKGK